MTNKLKKLIKNAEKVDKGIFAEFLIVPTEEPYDDNGYNKLIILAKDLKSERWVRVSKPACDAFNIIGYIEINVVDVPEAYECTRIVFARPLEVVLTESAVLANALPRRMLVEED
jgi:hypothetical protein